MYWRLCFDMTGEPPVAVLDAKFARMQKEYPAIAFDTGEKKPKPAAAGPVAKAKAKGKKAKQEEGRSRKRSRRRVFLTISNS